MISYITWDIDPQIIDGFAFLRWYGVCWAVGTMIGYLIVHKIYKKEGIGSAELDDLTIYLILGVVVGARLGHIIFYDPVYYWNNPIEILPIRLHPKFEFTGFEGLASHGGILGALLAVYLCHRKYKTDFWRMLDRLIIAGALVGSFIRIGNLMNSEIIGIPSQVPWAFIFSRVDQIPRHPAQLYEAIFYFLISVSLFFVWRSGSVSNYKGFLFGLGISLIFLVRFLVEFLKENQVGFEEQMKLNMGQVLSVPMIVGAVVLMIWSVRSAKAGDKISGND